MNSPQKITQEILVNACDAKTSASVVELSDGRRRVVVSDNIGDCWYDRATYCAPLSRAAAQRILDECVPFAAGPTQAEFIVQATAEGCKS